MKGPQVSLLFDEDELFWYIPLLECDIWRDKSALYNSMALGKTQDSDGQFLLVPYYNWIKPVNHNSIGACWRSE